VEDVVMATNPNQEVYRLSKWFIWQPDGNQHWVVTDWDPRKEWRGHQMRWHKSYNSRADAELAAMEMCEQ
jgi:hypothetical protein